MYLLYLFLTALLLGGNSDDQDRAILYPGEAVTKLDSVCKTDVHPIVAADTTRSMVARSLNGVIIKDAAGKAISKYIEWQTINGEYYCISTAGKNTRKWDIVYDAEGKRVMGLLRHPTQDTKLAISIDGYEATNANIGRINRWPHRPHFVTSIIEADNKDNILGRRALHIIGVGYGWQKIMIEKNRTHEVMLFNANPDPAIKVGVTDSNGHPIQPDCVIQHRRNGCSYLDVSKENKFGKDNYGLWSSDTSASQLGVICNRSTVPVIVFWSDSSSKFSLPAQSCTSQINTQFGIKRPGEDTKDIDVAFWTFSQYELGHPENKNRQITFPVVGNSSGNNGILYSSNGIIKLEICNESEVAGKLDWRLQSSAITPMEIDKGKCKTIDVTHLSFKTSFSGTVTTINSVGTWEE